VYTRILIFALAVFATWAGPGDLAGKWHVTVNHFGHQEYGNLTLEPKDGAWSGTFDGDTLTVALQGDNVEVRCANKQKECGKLTGRFVNGELRASGTVYDEEATFIASRVPARSESATRHEFTPKVFYNEFSSRIEPVLTVNPGDTVHTTTVDAGGVDAAGVHRAAGGNPLTGPFYIEGAWPGDTLVIRLNRLRLNRDTAGTYSNQVVLSSLDPYYARDQKQVKDFDSTWKLDREKGIAVLTKPTDRLKGFEVKLAPMLGCIGVAPRGEESFRSGRLGDFGGNMDYNQLREGTTVYLPVYHPGALLFVGDGHAAQGDGELTGNALETSMDVEFTVDLQEAGKGIRQPHAENAENIMVMGISNSFDDALRSATTGLSRWLEKTYGLNSAEIAMVLGSSMRYDVAEIVDPQVHVVARLSKGVLKSIPEKP
jgi:amidase